MKLKSVMGRAGKAEELIANLYPYFSPVRAKPLFTDRALALCTSRASEDAYPISSAGLGPAASRL